MARYLDEARQLSLSLFHWLQTEAPRPDGGTGYPGLYLRPDVTGTDDGLAKSPYVRESRRIRDLLAGFTPQIQFASIDEAYLDVTGSLRLFGGKRPLAERIRQRMEEETGLTASLGVAPNKLVAKIASDLDKPRGLVIVEPAEVEEFLRPLEVGRLPGVGPKLREVLARLGVGTMGDLQDLSR